MLIIQQLAALQLADELREEIHHDDGEEQAIDTIKDAAMSGHNYTAILDVGLAFDERFGKVAQRGGHADQ